MILRDNLERLAAAYGYFAPDGAVSQNKIATLAKVDAKTVNAIFKLEGTPRLATIEKLAALFRVAPWQLLMPDLPVDEDLNKSLARGLDLDAYALSAGIQTATGDARHAVLRFASFTFGDAGSGRAKVLVDKALAST